MMSKEIDPNILRQNIKYLRELEYSLVKDFDEHESITPTTNKGHLTQESKKKFFEEVSKRLQELKEQNEETDFFQKVKGNFQNQEQVDHFLTHQELALKSFVSDKTFVKKYQYKDSKTSEVLRFGINTKYKELLTELALYNKQLVETVNDAIQNKLENKSDISNISNESKYKPFCRKYIDLTVSEKSVLTNAIEYLHDSTNKVVLVDIFPRKFNNKNNDVGTIDVNSLDTHTAILYKTTSGKILVLDPNNPMFSAHIAKFGSSIEAYTSPNNLYKIYSRPDEIETGYHPKLYRDCIDISVKLAFGLNNDLHNYDNLAELMKSQTVRLVTNNPVIDNFFSNIKDSTFRSKQASDLEIIKSKNKLLESSWKKKLESEQHQLSTFNPIIKSIEESLKVTKDALQNNLGNIKIEYELELAGLDSDYMDM